MTTPKPLADFDAYATDYDAALDRGLRASGQSREWFAQRRIEWLRRCLRNFPLPSPLALDFGCGTGSAVPFLKEVPGLTRLLGVDVSTRSIEVAARDWASPMVAFSTIENHPPREEFGLAYCNGVFHHIPPAERATAVDYVHRSLAPGGFFAFWENNPWNPGTRLVMSRIPFDREAVCLSAGEAKRMLRKGGFEVLRTDFLFIFPSLLAWLRRFEPPLARFPLGAQYQVLCRKPESPANRPSPPLRESTRTG
jgi:SAM-dependent methyltransferase